MHLHLIRHGESTWNVTGRIQGQQNSPSLTDYGRQQVQAASHVVAGRLNAFVGFAAGSLPVFTSDLLRAEQSCAEIVQRLSALGLRCDITRTALLREQFLGSMEGKFPQQLEAEATPAGRQVSEVRWAGGESLQDVAVRLRRWLVTISQLPANQHLVVVSHGDTLRVLRALMVGGDHRSVAWEPWPNGHVHSMTWHPAS